MDQYNRFVFAKIHAGISLQPLSTPTAEYSLCHIYAVVHLLRKKSHIYQMKASEIHVK